MDKSAHTPGPWIVCTDKTNTGCIVGSLGDLVALAFPNPDRGEQSGNACLISAGPDMLAALKLIDTAAANQEYGPVVLSRDDMVFIRAAIAKAEGR
jgi:hypothetical protein